MRALTISTLTISTLTISMRMVSTLSFARARGRLAPG
jgi:hypothetical protein